MKAALHNLGCRVNAYECEMMTERLKGAGYEIVPFEERADVYIVNTCTVTAIADRKSRQMLHRAKELNPDAVVVACGCYVEDGRDQLLDDSKVDLLVGNGEKEEIALILERWFLDRDQKPLSETGSREEYPAENGIVSAGERARAFIKIEDGCNQFCSYCMIPYVRGRVRSRDEASILAEIRRLALNGIKEVILSGIHISSYGSAHYRPGVTNRALLSLIQKADETEGIERIRLGSLEPGVMTEEFTEGLAQLRSFCPTFHLSLQSGSDTVLKRMNRTYDTALYREICGRIRGSFEDPALTTDIICGFPGESKGEFDETLSFAEEIHFSGIHVFKYSRRQGTKAAAMPDQVPNRVKTERSASLMELALKMKREYAGRRIGKKLEILFEDEPDQEELAAIGLSRSDSDSRFLMKGHSREGIECYAFADQGLHGRIEAFHGAKLLKNGALYVE